MCRNISLSSMSALQARLTSPAAAEAFSPLCGMPYALVALDGDESAAATYRPNCPVIGIGEVDRMAAVPDLVDVAVESEAEAEVVTEAIKRNPITSMTLVGLLRHNERVSTEDALLAESLAYSTLQHGAEFQSWLASRPERRSDPDAEPPVLVERGERRASYHAEPPPQAQCLLLRSARWVVRSALPRGG